MRTAARILGAPTSGPHGNSAPSTSRRPAPGMSLPVMVDVRACGVG